MPEQVIPFGNREASGLPEESGAAPLAFNVVVDQSGAVHRRPGLRARDGFLATAITSSAVTGLWTAQNGSLYAVDGSSPVRHIYKVAGAATNLSPDATGALTGTSRPRFAETEAILVVAGGQQATKVVLTTDTASLLADTSSPSAPPLATHIVANSSRLVANDSANPNFVRFSDQAAGSSFAGHEQWLMAGIGTSGFVSADARPDNIVAIADKLGEIFVWGTLTLQVFTPDGQTVYAPVGTRQTGCGAPHSIISFSEKFAWLDQQRRFMVSDGRSLDTISDPIAQTLRDLTRTDDCFGYHFQEGWANVLVWTFPTDGLTFAYQEGTGWSRWSGWDGNWLPFIVTCRDGSGQTTTNTVGINDGRVGELSNKAFTDYDAPIRAYLGTGFIGHNTDRRKECLGVRIALRRGKTTGTGEPSAVLSFRDRPGAPLQRIPVTLGSSGDTEVVVQRRGLGVYRRRQWFFEFSGEDELVLASATEEYKELAD